MQAVGRTLARAEKKRMAALKPPHMSRRNKAARAPIATVSGNTVQTTTACQPIIALRKVKAPRKKRVVKPAAHPPVPVPLGGGQVQLIGYAVK